MGKALGTKWKNGKHENNICVFGKHIQESWDSDRSLTLLAWRCFCCWLNHRRMNTPTIVWSWAGKRWIWSGRAATFPVQWFACHRVCKALCGRKRWPATLWGMVRAQGSQKAGKAARRCRLAGAVFFIIKKAVMTSGIWTTVFLSICFLRFCCSNLALSMTLKRLWKSNWRLSRTRGWM